MNDDRTNDYFERDAAEFDGIIRKLIPNYGLMLDLLVSVIPFPAERSFAVMDLGCGTGAVSAAVAGKYPGAALTGVDLSDIMLRHAKLKLGDRITCIQADFNGFEFPGRYDLIVSSLALHHLKTDEDKLAFYKKIFEALNPEGQFINIDVVAGGSDALRSVYEGSWEAFIARHFSREEIESKWLPNSAAEDFPAPMTVHLDMMRSCGFRDIDIVYKYYKFAVYTGRK
jgi:tRNA (cmo5U34)-methyltransferase